MQIGIGFGLTTAGILLAFYLVLLVRPQCIKRSIFFALGAMGVVLTLVAGFFCPWLGDSWANVLVGILTTVGSLVAFIGAFAACYEGELPIKVEIAKVESNAKADKPAETPDEKG